MADYYDKKTGTIWIGEDEEWQGPVYGLIAIVLALLAWFISTMFGVARTLK